MPNHCRRDGVLPDLVLLIVIVETEVVQVGPGSEVQLTELVGLLGVVFHQKHQEVGLELPQLRSLD